MPKLSREYKVGGKPYFTGWCRPDQPEPHHVLCRGAFINPASKSVYRCACPCHTGEEAPRPTTGITAAKISKLSAAGGGKKSRAVLEEIFNALDKHGIFELPLTEEDEDPRVLKSKKERIYTAARRKGMKVKVRVKDGVITATPKIGEP